MDYKVINYKKISNCRISGSKKITKILDLGHQPLANSLKNLMITK